MNLSLISINILSLALLLAFHHKKAHGYFRLGVYSMMVNYVFYITYWLLSGFKHPMAMAMAPLASWLDQACMSLFMLSTVLGKANFMHDVCEARLPSEPYNTPYAFRFGGSEAMHRMLVLFAVAGLSISGVACSTNPKIKQGDFTVDLGRSFMEDTQSEMAGVTMPNGTKVLYVKEGKSQTKVPLALTKWYFADSMLDTAFSGAKSMFNTSQTEKTARALSTDKVAGQALTEKTAQTAILNPVE